MAPGLWQGGVKKYEGCHIALEDADVAVLLAPDTRVKIKTAKFVLFPLEDLKRDLRFAPELHDLAAELADYVRDGRRVVVLCRMGRNRSGILTGLILRELGMTGRDAVRHIKRRRRNALTGRGGDEGAGGCFAQYLAQLD